MLSPVRPANERWRGVEPCRPPGSRSSISSVSGARERRCSPGFSISSPGSGRSARSAYVAGHAELPSPCGVWSPVCGLSVLGSRASPRDDPAKLQAWRDALFAGQQDQIRALVAPDRPSPRLRRGLEELRATYELLARDGDVLVDESKNPWLGYLLSSQPWADVRFVELVRPPGDVIKSRSAMKNYNAITPREVAAKHWLRTCLTTGPLATAWARLAAPAVCAFREFAVRDAGMILAGYARRRSAGRVASGCSTPRRRPHRGGEQRQDATRPRHGAPCTSAPVPMPEDAGPWERAAHRYWNAWLQNRIPVSRRWSPVRPAPERSVVLPDSRVSEERSPVEAMPSA